MANLTNAPSHRSPAPVSARNWAVVIALGLGVLGTIVLVALAGS